MSAFERIWVIGAGAVGSVLAALLNRAGAPVTLVGGSVHWQAVRREGLLFEAGLPAGAVVHVATAAPAEVPALGGRDLVVLAGKLTRLAETAAWLRERLAPAAGLLALQNGLGIAEIVGRALGRPADRPAERALVYYGAHVPTPGRVRYFPGRVLLGAGPGAAALAGWLEGQMTVEVGGDVRQAEWEKLALNCLANPLAALLRVHNARLRDPALDPLKEGILAEVRAVMAAEGLALALTVPAFNAYMAGPTGSNTPSMAMDVRRGEPTEIEWINGAVVRLGRERGVPTPVNAALVTLVGFLVPRAPLADVGSAP